MGQRYSCLSKLTVRGQNFRIKYAVSSMQGFRPNMQNAPSAIIEVDGARITSFFGVYDGHGGANVARYCAEQFHTELINHEEYQNNQENAVRRVFSRVDDQLREIDGRAAAIPPRRFKFLRCLRCTAPCIKGTPYSEGSTACMALSRETRIIVGSVGDSRCVLLENGQALDLSADHKPNLQDEPRRIQNAGGSVTRNAIPFRCHRVNGFLAMSRSIDDFQVKSDTGFLTRVQTVTCTPNICTMDATHDTDLLMASDDIRPLFLFEDFLSSQDAANFVSRKLANGTPYSEGSTACMALSRETRIIVGSVGDSRCVLLENGQALDLSADHKPNLQDEPRRIQNAGGSVTRNAIPFRCHRVNGFLAMSRSIDDFQVKSDTGFLTRVQTVTCTPNICTMDATHDTDLLMASDDIRPLFLFEDFLSSQDAANFVSRKLANGTPYSEGSTACMALSRETRIIVGSVGDSRCVLLENGQALDLSADHKPNLQDEPRRIQNAGGSVTRNAIPFRCHRVNGFLAMSRSIDDFQVKSDTGFLTRVQTVTCTPNVCTMDATHDTDLLMASDDIRPLFLFRDFLSSQDAVNFVSRKLANGTTDLCAFKLSRPEHPVVKRRNIQGMKTKRIALFPEPYKVRLLHNMAGKGITKKRKIPGNTAEVILDPDNLEASRLSWSRGIKKAQAWCRENGIRYDLSDYIGPGTEVYTTPEKGTFHLTFKVIKRKFNQTKETKVTLFINALDLYLKGWKGRHGVFEVQPKDAKSDYVRNQKCRIVKVGENYNNFVDEGKVEDLRVGPIPMIEGVYVLDKCKGMPSDQVLEVIGMFVFNACEAIRLEDVNEEVDESFEDPNIITVDSRKRNLVPQVRSYGHYCREVLKSVHCLIRGQPCPEILNRRDLSYKSLQELLGKISVVKIDTYPEGIFVDKSSETQVWHPPYDDVMGEDEDDEEDEEED